MKTRIEAAALRSFFFPNISRKILEETIRDFNATGRTPWYEEHISSPPKIVQSPGLTVCCECGEICWITP